MNGMLGGQESYNGVVSVQGKNVQVTDGKTVIDGQQFLVAPDGAVYLSHEGQMIPVGRVIDGVFQEAQQPQQEQQEQLQMPPQGGMLGGMQ